MTLRHFEVFVAVCECKSITLAAEKLYMSQPAVSIAIKEIEGYYGVQLFIRANRTIYLTDKGEALFREAKVILTQYEHTKVMLKDETKFNKVSLGVNVNTAETEFSELIKKVRRANLEIEYTLKVGLADKLEDMLMENQLDLAILDVIENPKQFKAYSLYEDDMLVVCNPDYYDKDYISLEELGKHPLYLQERGTNSRKCVEYGLLHAGVNPIVKAEANSTLPLVQLAKLGNGFAVLSSGTAERFARDAGLRIVTTPPNSFHRHFFLVHHKNKILTPTMKAFIGCILE